MEIARGMSLLEVLVSLMLLSVSSLTLIQQQSRFYQRLSDQSLKHSSLQLAENLCQSASVSTNALNIPSGFNIHSTKTGIVVQYHSPQNPDSKLEYSC